MGGNYGIVGTTGSQQKRLFSRKAAVEFVGPVCGELGSRITQVVKIAKVVDTAQINSC